MNKLKRFLQGYLFILTIYSMIYFIASFWNLFRNLSYNQVSFFFKWTNRFSFITMIYIILGIIVIFGPRGKTERLF